jgi:hypothetical protein
MPSNSNGRHRPVEATHTILRRRLVTATEAVAPSANTIPYNDAVREAKQILAQLRASESKVQWRLGELADKVEPAYRQNTLKKFAEAIDIEPCTLERYRDVYRAWKHIPAPERESLSYAVARELATHPRRAEIVRDNPQITKREAAKIRRQLNAPPAATAATANPTNPTNDWRHDLAGEFRKALTLANDVIGFGRETGIGDDEVISPQLRAQMREVYEPLRGQLSELKKARDILAAYIHRIESALADEPPPLAEAAE